MRSTVGKALRKINIGRKYKGDPVIDDFLMDHFEKYGFCFGFFLAVGYMYVDRVSPRDVRGSMQNIYGVFFVSIGFFVGGLVGGEVGEWFTSAEDVRNWTGIWLSSAALCAVCVLMLIAFFPGRLPKAEDN